VKRLLLVEDEPGLVLTLRDRLTREGYSVDTSADGESGLERAAGEAFDLVLLDVMLPRINGLDVLRELRKRGIETPVIMLTAKGQVTDKVVGLKLGADDYVTKPFELPELVARIKAVLRRAAPGGDGDSTLSVAGLEIDPGGFSVRKGGEEVNLTATEFRLLHELARRPKQVFTRDLLLELVWNYEYLGDSRLVDAAVQRLRAKVEDDPKQPTLIRTVRGVGYRFDAG
jgi:DNA-binding response OmpR family regulator